MNRSLLQNAQANARAAIALAAELLEQAAQVRSEAREARLIAEHRRAEAAQVKQTRPEVGCRVD